MQDDALAYLDAYFDAMPPSRALGVRAAAYDGESLVLRAPLSANTNDKGCAFGGSLVSLATLAGWGLVSLRVRAAGLAAEVFVADSQVRYRAPLWDDLEARASFEDAAAIDGFLDTLRTRGRARIEIDAQVRLPDGGAATECRARYVAIAKG